MSPLTNQLCTTSRKVMIKYVGQVVIYKIIDPFNYLLRTLDVKILRGCFEHERLKPSNVRTYQRNVQNLAQLKQMINMELNFKYPKSHRRKVHANILLLIKLYGINKCVNIHFHKNNDCI